MAALYDRIVIGAGIIGSFTAYHLSKGGLRTLLLEQYSLSHTASSSHGHTRIIRKAYENDSYADMMEESYQIWKNIEDESDENIFIKTGIFEFEEKPYTTTSAQIKNLKRLNQPYEIFSHKDFISKYHQINVSEELRKLFEPSGGILLANKSRSVVQNLCRQNKAVIMENTAVESLEPGAIVTVRTNKGNFQGHSVVVCAGAWSRNILLPTELNIPVQAEKVWTYYWKEKNPGTMTPENYPCTRSHKNGIFYSIPSLEYPGLVKVSRHEGVRCTIENINEIKDDPHRQELIDLVKSCFPNLEPDPAIVQPCKHSTSPDDVCILDHHPKYRNIVFGTGFCGAGFKKAPTIGRILCDLVNNKQPINDMKPFAINRFAESDLV